MAQPRASRFSVQLPITFSGNHGAGSGLMCELSKEGCSMISEDVVRPGTALVLRIQLPDDETPVKADASVRWTDGIVFGLEFRRLSVKDKERLVCFVSALERASASRVRRAS